MAKKNLTNEKVKKLFKGNFLLASYAIHIGRDYLLSGHFSNLDALLVEIRKRAESVSDEQEKDQLGIK